MLEKIQAIKASVAHFYDQIKDQMTLHLGRSKRKISDLYYDLCDDLQRRRSMQLHGEFSTSQGDR